MTDLAEHTEVGQLSLPVASDALVIDAIPEGGLLREGVENVLYVMTSTPDGAPVEADVTVTLYDTGETLTAHTGTYGLAELRFTPTSSYTSMSISARDAAGTTAQRDFAFEGTGASESVLLRPDGAIYRVGDTMGLTILTSQQRGTVYLDIVREGQTVSTRAVDVANGHAEVVVDLTPDLYGTLELHAYKILSSGAIVRDTRLVVVDEANDLSVGLTAGADDYRPGDDGTLDVQVSGADGGGVQSAVGLAIVDESVFALAEQDPGFAKLYFMLEQELLEPKYELHGFSIPEMVAQPCSTGDGTTCPAPLQAAQEGAGKAALASAIPQADPFSLEANSHEQAMDRAYARQQAFYGTLATVSFGAFVLLPLAAVVLSGVAAARARAFWKSLGLAVAIVVLAGLSLLGLVWLADNVFWRTQGVLTAVVALVLGLLGLAGLIVLIVTAIRRKDLTSRPAARGGAARHRRRRRDGLVC